MLWFVWAEGKTHHLRKKVLARIEEISVDLSDVDAVQGTNMRLYYYSIENAQK